MKLKNKETGEIVDSEAILFNCFNSLAELNEKWEDVVEEPKTGWYLTSLGTPIEMEFGDNDLRQELEAIGNYFETKEEAEKAVEKLKAWKRLKEAGYYFTFDVIEEDHKHKYILRLECNQEKIMKPLAECKTNYRDLKILFGGEE